MKFSVDVFVGCALLLQLATQSSSFPLTTRSVRCDVPSTNRIHNIFGTAKTKVYSSASPRGHRSADSIGKKTPRFIDEVSTVISTVDSSAILDGFYGGLSFGIGIVFLIVSVSLPNIYREYGQLTTTDYSPIVETVIITPTTAVQQQNTQKTPQITNPQLNLQQSSTTSALAEPIKDVGKDILETTTTSKSITDQAALLEATTVTDNLATMAPKEQISSSTQTTAQTMPTESLLPSPKEAAIRSIPEEQKKEVIAITRDEVKPGPTTLSAKQSPAPKNSATKSPTSLPASPISLGSFLFPLIIGAAGFIGAYLTAKISTESSKQSLEVPGAPPGVATISRWKQNKNGSISGFISGAPNIPNGEPVITSPLVGRPFGGALVTTKSGSQYYLRRTDEAQNENDWMGPLSPEQPDAASVVLERPPQGVPIMQQWKENPDGSVSGYISGAKYYSDGDLVTTSPIMSAAIGGTVVETGSGSQYFLAPPETALDRKREARLARLLKKIPQNVPRGIPIILEWKVIPSGQVAGFILGSPKYRDGDPVTTSQLNSEPSEGMVIKTLSGSKYFLGERKPASPSLPDLRSIISLRSFDLDSIVMAMPGETAAQKVGVFMFLSLFSSSILASFTVTTLGQIDLGQFFFGGPRFNPNDEIVIPTELSGKELDDFFGL